MRPLARPGRRVRYKTLPSLEIPADLQVPTCDSCGAEWLDAATARSLDAALEVRFRSTLLEQARGALTVLTQHATQRRLEELLGLSHGYLSKLRAGDRIPSAEFVGHLALLARDPRRRLHELEELWASAA